MLGNTFDSIVNLLLLGKNSLSTESHITTVYTTLKSDYTKMFKTLKEQEDEENGFCILPEKFSSLDIEDFKSLKSSISCSSNVSMSPPHEKQTGSLEISIDEHTNCGKIMSDLYEDYPYGQYWNKLKCFKEKVICPKKCSFQQRLRQRQATFMKNPEGNQSCLTRYDVFDGPTNKILKSIITPTNYYRGQFGDVLGKGKNSVVLSACISTKRYPTWEPGAKPILIYAYINNEFNKRHHEWRTADKAVKVYKLGENDTKNERIFKQVQSEKEHLILLHKAKLNVPEVMRCSRNVIVMSMIGMDQETAPSISSIPTKLSKEMYHNIVKEITFWYNKLHLVHGKLSLKSILYWNGKLYYIGWSHSVKTDHPWALKKLMRDCYFITKFFEKRLVPVISTERLFKDITGLKEIDSTVLNILHSKDLWKCEL